MDSAIFRRNTRKGCGCMRGGAMSELNQQKKNLAGLNKQLNNPSLTYRVRQELQTRRNAKKVRVNALEAAAKNAGILNVLKNKVQNAVQVVKNNVTVAEKSVVVANNSAGKQAVIAANAAVVAANAAVNKSKNLAALANRANTLARNIRAMMGGKRHTKRRTHRK